MVVARSNCNRMGVDIAVESQVNRSRFAVVNRRLSSDRDVAMSSEGPWLRRCRRRAVSCLPTWQSSRIRNSSHWQPRAIIHDFPRELATPGCDHVELTATSPVSSDRHCSAVRNRWFCATVCTAIKYRGTLYYRDVAADRK